MKKILAAARALGPAGALGTVLLVLCLPFYVAEIRPAERELREQLAVAERLRDRSPLQTVSTRNRGDDLQRFYFAFPAVDKLPDELERVYGLARASKLDLVHGEYRLERHGDGLASYRMTLPVRGSYPDIREFVAATLKQMPYAAIETLRFERKKIGDSELDAQLRITLFFRPSNPSENR